MSTVKQRRSLQGRPAPLQVFERAKAWNVLPMLTVRNTESYLLNDT